VFHLRGVEDKSKCHHNNAHHIISKACYNFVNFVSMSSLIASARKVFEFVTSKIWKIRINKMGKTQALYIKQLRVFSLAFKGFQIDNCLTTATALTYYTLFSIVPVLALVFAIAKGFGYDKDLQAQILQSNQQYKEILENAFVYANTMLANTSSGAIAGIGIVVLLWSVMKLLISIEASFNTIWEVKRARSWARKITDYLTIMLVGPLLLIVSGGINVFIQSEVDSIALIGFAAPFFIKLMALMLVSLLFFFLYIALPNTKVNFKSAFVAGLIAGLFFEALGWAYIKFQIGANSMNAIYGGFAALPLFLIWVQYSWYIVLFGAELAYSFENVDHYELEDDIQNISDRYKKAIALMIANLVARRFYDREPALTARELSEKLDLPIRLTKTILNEFVATGVFAEIRTDNGGTVYHPGVTESKFTVKFVFDALDTKGINQLPITDTVEFNRINEIMAQIDQNLDTNLGHLQIKDLVQD
jgi:membrane protein